MLASNLINAVVVQSFIRGLSGLGHRPSKPVTWVQIPSTASTNFRLQKYLIGIIMFEEN